MASLDGLQAKIDDARPGSPGRKPLAALATVLVIAGLPARAASAMRVTPGGCRPARLVVRMTETPNSGAAGHIGYTLVVRNTGPGPCRLGNHPRLRLLGTGGRALPTHVVKLGAPAALTVPAGHTARSMLFFSPDVAGTGEPTTGPCEPVAHRVRVTLTGPATGSRAGSISPPTSVCEHGTLDEMPLR